MNVSLFLNYYGISYAPEKTSCSTCYINVYIYSPSVHSTEDHKIGLYKVCPEHSQPKEGPE